MTSKEEITEIEQQIIDAFEEGLNEDPFLFEVGQREPLPDIMISELLLYNLRPFWD